MRIGDLAKRARVTPRTIRFYGSIGLLPSGERQRLGHHHDADTSGSQSANHS